MTSATMRRWANYLLIPISQIDSQWLKPLMGTLWPAKEKILASASARRLLSHRFDKETKLPKTIPDPSDLKPAQRWLLEDIEVQKALAKSLGSLACAQQIKRIIDREGVNQIQAQLGREEHLRILNTDGLEVSGICGDVFLTHLKGDLVNFISCIGVGLLSQTVDEKDGFAKLRMGFAFSPKVFHNRMQGLQVNPELLEQAITGLTSQDH